jgi:1-deoxy-D-xylulose 5-phosphate reductoisomerase
MKKIAIFGATGSTGLHVTEVALKRGMINILNVYWSCNISLFLCIMN